MLIPISSNERQYCDRLLSIWMRITDQISSFVSSIPIELMFDLCSQNLKKNQI